MDVIIGPPGPEDADEFLAAVRASRELHRPWLFPPASRDQFRSYLARAGHDDYAAYLIRHASCGRLAGYVSITNIVRGALQSGFAGYGAFAGHEGHGLMTAGLAEVLGEAFGPLRLHRVEANIQPGNTQSVALVRRLGFEKEGFSPRYLNVDGAWRDHERWAIRAETWYADGGRERAGRKRAGRDGADAGDWCSHHDPFRTWGFS